MIYALIALIVILILVIITLSNDLHVTLVQRVDLYNRLNDANIKLKSLQTENNVLQEDIDRLKRPKPIKNLVKETPTVIKPARTTKKKSV